MKTWHFIRVCLGVLAMLGAWTPTCGQYDSPETWRLEDLEKLERPCVSSWRIALDKRGRPTRDSTLSYCLCYNRRDRTMTSALWVLADLNGAKDSVALTEQFLQFDGGGFIESSVVRRKHFASNVLGSYSEVAVQTYDRSETGIVLNEVSAQFFDSTSVMSAGQLILSGFSQWRMNAVEMDKSRVRRNVSLRKGCSECAIHTDSTVFVYLDEQQDWHRALQYAAGRLQKSTTRSHRAGQVTHSIDSAFATALDSVQYGWPIWEENFRYDDTLLVEKETIDWTSSLTSGPYKPGQGIMTYVKPGHAPDRKRKRFYYDDGSLVRVVFNSEHDGILDSTVHAHGPEPPLDQLDERVTKRTSNGLPLLIKDETPIITRSRPQRDSCEYHIHYSATWPTAHRRPDELLEFLLWLKTYRPK